MLVWQCSSVPSEPLPECPQRQEKTSGRSRCWRWAFPSRQAGRNRAALTPARNGTDCLVLLLRCWARGEGSEARPGSCCCHAACSHGRWALPWLEPPASAGAQLCVCLALAACWCAGCCPRSDSSLDAHNEAAGSPCLCSSSKLAKWSFTVCCTVP